MKIQSILRVLKAELRLLKIIKTQQRETGITILTKMISSCSKSIQNQTAIQQKHRIIVIHIKMTLFKYSVK